MINWLFYTIPENKRLHYFISLYLALAIIPEYVLGMIFTIPMQFLNFIFFDILYYVFLKIEKFDD
jgi:hypothetical protein